MTGNDIPDGDTMPKEVHIPNQFNEITNGVKKLDKICANCKTDLLETNPKLLSCLHTLCQACVGELSKGFYKNIYIINFKFNLKVESF